MKTLRLQTTLESLLQVHVYGAGKQARFGNPALSFIQQTRVAAKGAGLKRVDCTTVMFANSARAKDTRDPPCALCCLVPS